MQVHAILRLLCCVQKEILIRMSNHAGTEFTYISLEYIFQEETEHSTLNKSMACFENLNDCEMVLKATERRLEIGGIH